MQSVAAARQGHQRTVADNALAVEARKQLQNGAQLGVEVCRPGGGLLSCDYVTYLPSVLQRQGQAMEAHLRIERVRRGRGIGMALNFCRQGGDSRIDRLLAVMRQRDLAVV